jgi:hypothetical protein
LARFAETSFASLVENAAERQRQMMIDDYKHHLLQREKTGAVLEFAHIAALFDR